MGLAPYSTEVEHVHEKRYRGVQHVTLAYLSLNYLLYTTNVYIIITLEEPRSVGLRRGYIIKMLQIAAQKRRIPEVRLAGRMFFGPFFIRILTTFALWALPNVLIRTI